MSFLFIEQMSKVPYQKSVLQYAEQLQKVKERGLIVRDEKRFLKLVELKSYYRLSGYWYPLLEDKRNHIFKSGASFDAAMQMYSFDSELRRLMNQALEKIEIAVRAKMIYIMAHSFGAYWYMDSNRFKNIISHSQTILKIAGEYNRSDANFISAFKHKYSNELPPCWTAFEIISFGVLSKLYQNLRHGKSKREIANWFGLDDKTFSSWLHSFVYVRNICAHHSRLWNVELRIQPRYPDRPFNVWLMEKVAQNNRMFFVFSMIIYFLQTIDGNIIFLKKLKTLIAKYPTIDTGAMGFPVNWEHEPLWQ